MSFIDLLDHNSIKEQLQSYFAVKLAEEHNIHVLLTDTFALNKPAQGLFEKFGFIKVGEAEIDYHPFDRGAPFYAYYKTFKNRG